MRNPDLVTLLLTLGYGVDDQIVLASNSTGIFAPIVCKGMRDAVRQAALHSAADVWITVNPMRPITAGRGTADDVERLAALWVDLDFKTDGAGDEATAREIIRELSMILGTPPAAVVESGGGLHPYWPITDGLDIDAARVLLARWRDLVERVAADNGANVDAVFDLPRVLRCPGTSNHKSGTAREVVTTFADDDEWQALTIDDVSDRLSDAGILTPTLDSIADGVAVDSWPVGDGVCAYVSKMIAGWADDRPTARHPWVASAAVRVACACRAGCIGTLEARKALETLTGRLVDLTSGDADQGTRRDYTQATREIESLWKWAIGQVETMTDAQVAKELGGHSHEPLPTLDDLVIPAQTDSAQDDADTGSTGDGGRAKLGARCVENEDAVFGLDPKFEWVRDLARSRMVSPWALLTSMIARAVSDVAPRVVIPPYVGSKASLNTFVCLVGSSNAGKSTAVDLAMEVLPSVKTITLQPSSGEGIPSMFVSIRGGETKQIRTRAFTSVDEIATLGAQMDRSGSTLGGMLRSAWSGKNLSNFPSDETKRRILEAHTYRWCLVAGAQYSTASVLTGDEDAGTPQRFLWIPAADPLCVLNAPRVEMANSPFTNWQAPLFHGRTHSEITFPDHVAEQVQATRYLAMKGEDDATRDASKGHSLLVREKISAGMAILLGSYDVTDEIWAASGILADISSETYAGVKEHAAKGREQAAKSRGRADAVASESRHDYEVSATAQRLVAYVRRHPRPDGLTKRDLRNAARPHRELIDEALAYAVAAGALIVEMRPHPRNKSSMVGHYFTPKVTR